MKILTKFIGSSVALLGIILSVNIGSDLLIKQKEKSLELTREKSSQAYGQVSRLKLSLREQIGILKDYLILNRDPTDMRKYYKAMSEFILTLDQLENLVAENSALAVVRRRYKFLTNLARDIRDQPSSLEVTQQDFRVINSYRDDIDFSLTLLVNSVRKQNTLLREETKQFNQTTQIVRYATTGIIILFFCGQIVLILIPVVRSIQQLQNGAAKIGAGNLDYRLAIHTKDEIEQLANEFNQMAAKLADSYHFLEDKVIQRTTELMTANQSLEKEIVERKQAEQAQARLTYILEATTDFVGIANAERKVVYINISGRKMLGISEDYDVTNMLITDIVPQSVIDYSLNDILLSAIINEVWTGESALLHRDGREILISQVLMSHKSESGEVEFFSTIARDITERKQAEELLQKSEERERDKATELARTIEELKKTQSQLIQTEKMSSLGQLVAGVAHEINNPVNFIHGNITHAEQYIQDLLEIIQLYQQQYPTPNPEIQNLAEDIDLAFLIADLPKMLSSMKVGTERIRQIVLSLRNFSRLDEADMKLVNIHEGIDSTLLILQNRLKATKDSPEIQIVKEYSNLPLVECYPGQLNQVFMNILSNALDALESYNQQRSPQELTSNPSKIIIRTQVLNSNRITISIADNGIGMPEQVKNQIFDPFFTTKPVGKGTGMGLSISYQIIVEKHKGILHCESEIGKGTEFLIEIPVQQSQILKGDLLSSKEEVKLKSLI